MKCPICKHDMESDIYRVKKGNGQVVKDYYCSYCCKVRQVLDEVNEGKAPRPLRKHR